jgi:hypothetical protein
VNEHTWKPTKHFSNSKENMKFMDAYPMPFPSTFVGTLDINCSHKFEIFLFLKKG